mmetsp:Transcript_121956/g.390180  ORF Transcript_121956/g.390180 Transcript_121956/m.390180 type:complete len:82 (-) Transcript_121956:118-363(-)
MSLQEQGADWVESCRLFGTTVQELARALARCLLSWSNELHICRAPWGASEFVPVHLAVVGSTAFTTGSIAKAGVEHAVACG